MTPKRVLLGWLVGLALVSAGCGGAPGGVGRYAVVALPPSGETTLGATFKVDTVTGKVWVFAAGTNGRWQLIETDSVPFK